MMCAFHLFQLMHLTSYNILVLVKGSKVTKRGGGGGGVMGRRE